VRVPDVERRRRRRSFKLRGWLIAGGVLLIILLFSLRGLAGFYTDFLWFDSVEQGSTWRQLLTAKIVPALVFTVVFFVIMLANLLIADRLAPKYRSTGPEDELVERYQQFVAPFQGRIRVGIALFFALVAGVGVSAQWQEWVLFTNRVDFGVKDPQFDMDVGFYVFQLPFLRFIADWLFAGLVIVLLVTAVAHYLNGGIRFQSPFQRVTPQVKAHISVILALMALVKSAQYYLDRFQLNFSTRGAVQGASYTDVNAQLPALNLLIFISIVAAALFIWNIWRRGWVLPIIAVGLWGFVAIVIGTIYPAGVQKFRVDPNEYQSERRYIERNITATRAAYGLTNRDVEVKDLNYQETIEPETVQENLPSIENARLWDPEVIRPTYQTLQGFQTFYRLDDVDIDRYEIDGQVQQVTVSAREINSAELPSRSWVNEHLVYTHGYGIVASPTNAASGDGDPEILVGDIPIPESSPIEVNAKGAELYFGESLPGYSLVDAKQREFNYPTQGRQRDQTNRYRGKDGVVLSNVVKRAAFALRFGDINPLISGQIDGDTRILFIRDIRERVEKLAPFLDYDADPYPVVIRGRVKWVVDAYTTTNKYPYSQSVTGPADTGLNGEFNYVRNSVKATVDAYDGTVKFYVMDPKDPLIRAYRKAFPDLFTDKRAMSDELEAHLRYPEDLFRVQTDVFASYHVTESRRFYQGNARWLLSPDPGSGRLTDAQLRAGTTTQIAPDQELRQLTSTGPRMRPYYLNITLPGETEPSFLILQPFVPVSQGNQQTRLVSYMVADSDPGEYGEMTAFQMPEDPIVLGPVQIDNEINTTVEISEQLTLLSRGGSSVIQGSMQLIPIGDSILYVRPYYVEGTAESSYPQFRFVVVTAPGQDLDPVLDNTIQGGLNQLFDLGLPEPESVPDDTVEPDGGAPPPEGETPPDTTPDQPGTGSVQDLLDQASEAFQQAEAALRQGDFAEYERLIERAAALVDQARGTGDSGPAPTTTTQPPGDA
jgi:uncharacterized membrane protein (UPF0182 family)